MKTLTDFESAQNVQRLATALKPELSHIPKYNAFVYQLCLQQTSKQPSRLHTKKQI